MADALAPVPQVEADLLPGLITDLAQGIYEPEDIAERYALGSAAALYQFLQSHPVVRKQIQRYRAAYMSDDSVEKRIRQKAGLATEDIITDAVQMIRNPTISPSQKREWATWLSRNAGTDGPVPTVGRFDGTASGAVLNLNIIFSDGRKEQLSVMPTIEHAIASVD